MIERRCCDFRNIDVLAHHAGNIGAPSKSRMFEGQTPKVEVSNTKIGGRKTNIFQKGRERFKITIKLNAKCASRLFLRLHI
jgi:hypothetical protein